MWIKAKELKVGDIFSFRVYPESQSGIATVESINAWNPQAIVIGAVRECSQAEMEWIFRDLNFKEDHPKVPWDFVDNIHFEIKVDPELTVYKRKSSGLLDLVR
jgi:hypothetical protein